MANPVSNTMHTPELLDRKYLVSVILVAFMINLVVWYLSKFSIDIHFQLAPFLQIDSLEYLNLGKQIFENSNFQSFSRTPIYPFFVGFFHTVLGLSLDQLILVNIALSLVNIYLIWRLAACFLAPKYQLFIALVFALDPVTIQVSNYLLSETLFSFLLLISLNLLVYLRCCLQYYVTDWCLALLCGICLGLFALCRPVGQFLPFILVVWFLFVAKAKNRYMIFLIAALILVAFMLIPEAWKERNYRVTGHSFISTTTSINMYNYRAAWNVARRDGRTFIDVKQEFQDNRQAFARKNTHLVDYEIAKHFTTEGLNIILDTPWETVQQAIRGLVYLYGGVYNASIDRIMGGGLSALLVKIYSIIYLLLVYIGLIFSLFFYKKLSPNQKPIFILSVIAVSYFTFFSIGVESYARLRTPFFPYLVIISALGWLRMYENKFSK